jgi:hypothetical protein
LLIVIGLIGMMAGIAMVSFGALWGNLGFKRQADELVNAFRMAQDAAAQSDRRYAIILDFVDQKYILREFKSLDLETMDPDEAVIKVGYFSNSLFLDYVMYDDEEFVSVGEIEDADVTADTLLEARFLAGHSGWQYGGKVVLLDGNGYPWTLVIHRYAQPAELLEGDWDLETLGMLPMDKQDVPF